MENRFSLFFFFFQHFPRVRSVFEKLGSLQGGCSFWQVVSNGRQENGVPARQTGSARWVNGRFGRPVTPNSPKTPAAFVPREGFCWTANSVGLQWRGGGAKAARREEGRPPHNDSASLTHKYLKAPRWLLIGLLLIFHHSSHP